MDNPQAALHKAGMGADFLRRMDWLGRARVRGYMTLLALLNVGMLVWLIATSHGGIDANGFLIGSDFLSFWTTGRMLHAGSDPYDAAAHIAAQRAYYASDEGFTAFFYPPSFLPFCWPLGLLGYFPALAAWLGLTGAAWLLAAQQWLVGKRVGVPLWLMALAFPALPIVLTHGQTSFLVAALLGLGALLVPRSPVLAGALFGLATIKPQFGLLLPLALLASREWRAIGAAVLCAAALAAVSAIAFRAPLWTEWFAATARAQDAMALGAVGYAKMTSAFSAAALLGAPIALAYAVQALVTLGVAIVATRTAWRQGWSTPLAAVVLAGAVLATPFVLDYDLVLMAFPMLWLVGDGLRTGFAPYEKLALLLTFVLPAFARPLAMNAGVPLAPLVLIGFFAVIARRATTAIPEHSSCEGELAPT